LVTVNAALLQGQFHDTHISDADAAFVLNGAIYLLNTFGAGLTDLVAGTGTYNAADDSIDDATVAGIIAPVPEASTLVLLATGITSLFVVFYLRKRRARQS